MALLIDPVMLGKRLQEVRSIKKMTQAELAEKVKVSRKTLIGLEAGENTSTHTLFRVINALGLSMEVNDSRVDLTFIESLVEPYQ